MLKRIMLLALLSACSGEGLLSVSDTSPSDPWILARASGPVPALDQPAWFEALQGRRPELMSQYGDSVDDPAWQAMVIRPKWRHELLETSSTYETIIQREYADDLRKEDDTWVESLQAAQRAYVPTETVRPGTYPLDAYVSFVVGPRGRIADADDYTWKTFFELDDFQRALSDQRYSAFSAALGRAGFRGDSKIDIRPGQVRFQYNNVIVHAPSAAMAQCAEAVGLKFFAGALLHVARGVDPPEVPQLDWHHFLLTGRFSSLPEAVRDFVQYRTPVVPCPIPQGE